MFFFENDTVESVYIIIASLDDAGRKRVDDIRRARIASSEAVKKLSIERGTYNPSHERISLKMIDCAVRKEANKQARILAKREKDIEKRVKLRIRKRYERSDAYKKECRDEMAKLGCFVL